MPIRQTSHGLKKKKDKQNTIIVIFNFGSRPYGILLIMLIDFRCSISLLEITIE